MSTKLIAVAVVCSVLTVFHACGNKGTQNKPEEAQTGVAYVDNPDQPPVREKPLEGLPDPNRQTFPGDTSERKPPPVPDFFDVSKRQVKDLPTPANASIINMQYGPISGNETVLIFFNVRATFEEVTTFYDKAIKENGWTVQTNTREPDDCVWRLVKGAQDQALLQVKKLEEVQTVQVGINRFRTAPQPAN